MSVRLFGSFLFVPVLAVAVLGGCYESETGSRDERSAPRNLICDDRSNTCERRAARGEPCLTGTSWGDTCEIGSVCDRNGTRRCVEPTPVGEPCEPIENLCEGLACIAGFCREPFFLTTSAWSCAE